MCTKVVGERPCSFERVPNQFKKQEMCNDAVRTSPFYLEYVPDWFVTQEQLKIWYDNDNYCNDNKLIKWYNCYQNRKAQKASITEELIFITWHPSRWWDCCVPEDEIKEAEKLWA